MPFRVFRNGTESVPYRTWPPKCYPGLNHARFVWDFGFWISLRWGILARTDSEFDFLVVFGSFHIANEDIALTNGRVSLAENREKPAENARFLFFGGCAYGNRQGGQNQANRATWGPKSVGFGWRHALSRFAATGRSAGRTPLSPLPAPCSLPRATTRPSICITNERRNSLSRFSSGGLGPRPRCLPNTTYAKRGIP